MFPNKRHKIIVHMKRDIEFLDEEANKEYKELRDLQRAGTLKDKFPADRKVNRKASNYHTLDMLYKNPDAPANEREYHEGVCKYRPDPKTAPEYIIEFEPEDVELAKKALKVATRAFGKNVEYAKTMPNASRALPFVDERNGLTFEEAELLVASKAPKTDSKESVKTK